MENRVLNANEAVEAFIELVEVSYIECVRKFKKKRKEKIRSAFSGSIITEKGKLKVLLKNQIKDERILKIEQLLESTPSWIFNGEAWTVEDANELYHNHYRIIGNKIKNILTEKDSA
jgi:hypothetical protein